MSVARIEVKPRLLPGKLIKLTKEAKEYLNVPLEKMEMAKFYHVDSPNLTDKELRERLDDISAEVFSTLWWIKFF